MKKKLLFTVSLLSALVALASCSKDNGGTSSVLPPTSTESKPEDTTETHNHDLIDVEAKPATCLEAGYNAYKKCKTCDYSTFVEIKALGHHLTKTDAVEATWSTQGNDEFYYCDVCEKYFDEEEKEIDDPYFYLYGFAEYDEELGGYLTNIDKEDLLSKVELLDGVKVTFPEFDFDLVVPVTDNPSNFALEDCCLVVLDDSVYFSIQPEYDEEGELDSVLEYAAIFLEDTEKTYEEIRLFNYKENEDPITLYGKDIEIEFNEDDYDTYIEFMSSIVGLAEAGELSWDEMEALYDEATDNYYFLIDQYRYAGIIADTTANKEDYELQDLILELINELEAIDMEIDLAMYDSVYKDDYYADYTPEELEAYIASLDPEAKKQENEYDALMNEALTGYMSGELEFIDALTTYVANANEIAKLNSYSDYLEYAYNNVYGREYTVADSSALATYITEYIVPTMNVALDIFINFRTNSSEEEWNEFYGLYYNFFGGYLDIYDAYADMIGDEYLTNYSLYFESGNYYYSAIPNDNVTGYVTTLGDGTPIMFLGPDYQNVSTFIHEFGHYNAALTEGDTISYDLDEVQSQGNELLFYTFMVNECSTEEELDPVTTAYLAYNLYTMCSAVIEGALINELEKWVYTASAEDLTEENLFAKWEEICLDFDLEEYVEYTDWVEIVLMNYHGYYISYATSAVVALELFAVACHDYDVAIESYKVIYTHHDESYTFTSVLEAAGLESVFVEDGYILINDAVNVLYAQLFPEE